MIVSAASLYFRDVKFIVEVFLTFGIFFTPVFYDVGMFGDKGKWLLLNPDQPDSGWFQRLHRPPSTAGSALVCLQPGFALVAFVGGYIFFKHLEPGFAESI